MIVRLVGALLQAVGRLRGGDAGRDLEVVGEELGRLARARRQPPAAAR
jgi:hypothetical protein